MDNIRIAKELLYLAKEIVGVRNNQKEPNAPPQTTESLLIHGNQSTEENKSNALNNDKPNKNLNNEKFVLSTCYSDYVKPEKNTNKCSISLHVKLSKKALKDMFDDEHPSENILMSNISFSEEVMETAFMAISRQAFIQFTTNKAIEENANTIRGACSGYNANAEWEDSDILRCDISIQIDPKKHDGEYALNLLRY